MKAQELKVGMLIYSKHPKYKFNGIYYERVDDEYIYRHYEVEEVKKEFVCLRDREDGSIRRVLKGLVEIPYFIEGGE